jgi:hypothetical protein
MLEKYSFITGRVQGHILKLKSPHYRVPGKFSIPAESVSREIFLEGFGI